jgi:FkbM family methyltransferase
MKVFLDVGAYEGQTLTAVLPWAFDKIFCFEPNPAHHEKLLGMADERTTIAPFGLWNQDAKQPLYNPIAKGASLWKRPERPENYTVCRFVRATDWLRSNLHGDLEIWMKLNVEGAELDILEDLLASGEIRRIKHLLVMWDARKIPELTPRMAAVRAAVDGPGVTHAETIIAKSVQDRIDAWLSTTDIARRA